MPVRPLTSSVLRWPEAASVTCAAARWAREIAAQYPGLVRIGYSGSYGRGNRGVRSDLELMRILERADRPFALRSGACDTTRLPAPADVPVHLEAKWEASGALLHREVIRVRERPATGGAERVYD